MDPLAFLDQFYEDCRLAFAIFDAANGLIEQTVIEGIDILLNNITDRGSLAAIALLCQQFRFSETVTRLIMERIAQLANIPALADME